MCAIDCWKKGKFAIGDENNDENVDERRIVYIRLRRMSTVEKRKKLLARVLVKSS